jgi:hypothetical protein
MAASPSDRPLAEGNYTQQQIWGDFVCPSGVTLASLPSAPRALGTTAHLPLRSAGLPRIGT